MITSYMPGCWTQTSSHILGWDKWLLYLHLLSVKFKGIVVDMHITDSFYANQVVKGGVIVDPHD